MAVVPLLCPGARHRVERPVDSLVPDLGAKPGIVGGYRARLCAMQSVEL